MSCPNCRQPRRSGANFCEICGYRLSAGAPGAADVSQHVARSVPTESSELAGLIRRMMRIDLVVLCLSPLIFACLLTVGHLYFARGDLGALRDCERRVGAVNCSRVHGTYDEIVADCEAWPPVLAEHLSDSVERLCAVVLSDDRTR